MVIQNLKKLYFIAKCILINKENQILILKRSNYKNNGTGNLWDFPGGNVNLYEDVNIAINREVKEETQITLNKIEVFSVDSCKKPDQEAQVIFTLFSSKDFDPNQEIKLSEEHTEYKWISKEEIDNYEYYLSKERKNKIKNYINLQIQ